MKRVSKVLTALVLGTVLPVWQQAAAVKKRLIPLRLVPTLK